MKPLSLPRPIAHAPAAPGRAPLRRLHSVAIAAGIAALVAGGPSPAAAAGRTSGPDGDWLLHGTWRAGRDDHRENLWVSFRVENGSGSRSEHWTRLRARELEGLDPSRLGDSREPVEFKVTRDAGVIRCKGEFSRQRGEGSFDLELEPRFAGELARRGVGRPARGEQARLLLAGAGYDLLDAIAREKYAAPDIELLVRMAQHAVDEPFISGMARAGYRLPDLERLVTARDHGVNPEFIHEMAGAGYRGLEFDVLLRARDHGADAEFAADLAEAGFARVPLETLIRARDHGVEGAYIEALRRAGFAKLTLEEAIRARDHGVSGSFARRMRERHPAASLDEVIAMRDRRDRN